MGVDIRRGIKHCFGLSASSGGHTANTLLRLNLFFCAHHISRVNCSDGEQPPYGQHLSKGDRMRDSFVMAERRRSSLRGAQGPVRPAFKHAAAEKMLSRVFSWRYRVTIEFLGRVPGARNCYSASSSHAARIYKRWLVLSLGGPAWMRALMKAALNSPLAVFRPLQCSPR